MQYSTVHCSTVQCSTVLVEMGLSFVMWRLARFVAALELRVDKGMGLLPTPRMAA